MPRGKRTVSKGQSRVEEEEEECERSVEHSAFAGSCRKVNKGARRMAAPQVLRVLYRTANSNSPSNLAIRLFGGFIPFIFSRQLLNVLKIPKNPVKTSKRSPNIPVRLFQFMPFKMTES